MRNAYTVHRPVINAYLVRERDRRRLRDLALVLLAVFPLALGLMVYTWLQLETGDVQPEAIGLYQSSGWIRVPNYGQYEDDPRSICFGLRIVEP